MTREDIMHMAREAGVRMDYIFDSGTTRWILQPGLMRFAALVIARREAQSIHTCGPDCQKPPCVNRRREIAAAVEAEREAICPIVYGLCISDNNAQEIVNAIRARKSK
jgi:hypothetical protein